MDFWSSDRALASKKKLVLEDVCHQHPRAREPPPPATRKLPRRLRRMHIPTAAEVEANIKRIVYQGMVFYDYEPALKRLDPELEVKIWETIVRRCRQFPELILMMAELDLLGAQKWPAPDPNSLLNIEFNHDKKRRKALKDFSYFVKHPNLVKEVGERKNPTENAINIGMEAGIKERLDKEET